MNSLYNCNLGEAYEVMVRARARDIRHEIDQFKQCMGVDLIAHQKNVSITCIAMGAYAKLGEKDIARLAIIADIHDVGKVRLVNETEHHAGVGSDFVRERKLQLKLPYIDEIIKYHHERIDGLGPYGRKKMEIPLFSRIIAVADRLDNLLYVKGKRTEKSLEASLEEIKRGANDVFDPFVVDMLIKVKQIESSETLYTFAFCMKSNNERLTRAAQSYKARDWNFLQVVTQLQNEWGVGKIAAETFTKFAFGMPIETPKTFDRSNVISYLDLDKKKGKELLIGSQKEMPRNIIVYTRKPIEGEEFKLYDPIHFEQELWNIKYVDNTRYMLAR